MRWTLPAKPTPPPNTLLVERPRLVASTALCAPLKSTPMLPFVELLPAADKHRQDVVERAARVQIDVGRLSRNFREQALILLIQRAAAAGERGRRRLRRERLQAIEDRRNIAQATVNNLQLADAVVSIGNALREFRDAAAQTVCNRQAGRIVAAAVDAITGCKLLNGLALELIVDAQIALRIERIDVSLK